MIFGSAVEQANAMRAKLPEFVRLAKVTSLSNGRANIQFYGETSPSSKLYPYIEGYKPAIGDDVLLLVQAETYIIIGKISKENIVDNYYLIKSIADTLYLTKAVADELYQPKGSSALPQGIGNTYYNFRFQNDTSDVIQQYNYPSAPAQQRLTFGTPSNYLARIYVAAINLQNSGDIIPAGNGSNIGSSSSLFNAGYFSTLGAANANGSIQQLNVKNATIYGTSIAVNTNNSVNMGASGKQFNNVYAKQFYQNGTAISTSDRRKKTGIREIGRKYIEFFKKLKPRLFRFKDGESGRLHSGFVAQEVEEAAVETGIPNKDLAFLCIDENGDYGLRYEELIAIQTKVIQELLERVDGLEKRVGDLEKIIKGGKG